VSCFDFRRLDEQEKGGGEGDGLKKGRKTVLVFSLSVLSPHTAVVRVEEASTTALNVVGLKEKAAGALMIQLHDTKNRECRPGD